MQSQQDAVISSTVDVIIPVYRGLAETRACIESVLTASNETRREIVVVNDASPELDIARYLKAQSAAGHITLIENEQNLGFVLSCNRAMMLHPDRDVVLLNSDTQVEKGWLDRMIACAEAAPGAASVTPFSNNATICSYPVMGKGNSINPASELAGLDATFARINAGKFVEIPTGVGFCMLMKRVAIDAVGALDAKAFGRGYGEENDWCQRAEMAGFKHYLCADTYVFHRGEVSFGANAETGKIRAQAIIDERYPRYREQIARFFQDDPARLLRRSVDLARLVDSHLPILLFVTHPWGGGTEQHVLDLIELVSERANVLLMKPSSSRSVSISWVTGHTNREEFAAIFNALELEETMLPFLKSIGIARIHVHHIQGYAPEILNLAKQLGVPLDVTLHDYFPVTPRYHLEHGGVVSSDDLKHAWGWSIDKWRSTMREFLHSADRVICPSKDLAGRIHAFYPEIKLSVWPHPERVDSSEKSPAKILLLGGLTDDKGLKVVLACAEAAQASELPLFFRLIGHTEHSVTTYPDLPFSFSGSYPSSDLDMLIALERADAIMFPAQIPESYSFTLSAAMRSGLPIIASRLGAFPERLADYPKSTLLEWNAMPREWNEALSESASMRVPDSAALAETVAASKSYRDKYLAPVQRRETDCTVPKLALSHYFFSRELPRDREQSLAELYARGIKCGYATFKQELEKRIGEFDDKLKMARESADAAHEAAKEAGRHSEESALRFQAVFNERQKMVEAAQKDAEVARAHYQQVVNSTTWRITKPARSVVHRLKKAARKLISLRQRARLFPLYAATAVQILRQQGVAALIARVRARFKRSKLPIDLPVQNFTAESDLVPLSVSASENPRWTVIVPVFGQHALTYTCLKSIANTCAGTAIEVIVADDCSPEPASEALWMVRGVRFARNEKNLGFLHTCNVVAAKAKGEMIVLLNNDTIVTGDWLNAMTSVFSDDPKAGLVGVKLLFADGKLQEAGGIVWREGSASNYGRGQDPRRPEFNYRREVDYCSGACVMIPARLWRQLGGFDVRYAPAYYEDTDLAFRVREAGYRVVYQPHAEVVHFEGQSSGTDLTQGVKQYQVINQKTFRERWSNTLANHRSHGLAPHLERDRGALRRVLVIDTCLVMPDRDSGSLRMYEMLKIMRELGCRVSFVADNKQHPEQYARLTQSLGVEVLNPPFVPSARAAVSVYGADFDVAMISRASVAAGVIDDVKRHMPQAKIIFDTVDLHFLRQQREAELAGSTTALVAAAATMKLELNVIAKSDVTLVVSSFERDLLTSEAPRSQVHILSNIHEPSPGSRLFAERSGVVFIGGFRHSPNVDAMIWYATEVLPLLRASGVGIRTTVIGSDVPENVQVFATDDFVIAGYVPDVEPLFNDARVAISPLRYGAGVKGKVNLAMQFGVPVVATACSVEGMNLAAGKDVLVGNDAAAFADSIVTLYGDERLWLQLRQGGLENIKRCFSRDKARAVLRHVLDL
jgi:O-antigen biosynthesis protein